MKKMIPYLVGLCIAVAPSLPILASSFERNVQKEEANRSIILSYYSEPDHLKRLKFMADDYIQHNPMIGPGKKGVEAFFSETEKKFPHAVQRVIRTAADGDYVWVQLNTIPNPGERGMAVINIFRLENGKIAEHWDVIQPVPEKSANGNSMF